MNFAAVVIAVGLDEQSGRRSDKNLEDFDYFLKKRPYECSVDHREEWRCLIQCRRLRLETVVAG